MNVLPGSLIRPCRRILQMHKEDVSRLRRWHAGTVQIDGLLLTCNSYPSSPTGLRREQVDLNSLHPLRWVEALLKTFVSELFERTEAVLLCNDYPMIGWRQKNGLESMQMKHRRCGQITYLVIGMHSRSRGPQEGFA